MEDMVRFQEHFQKALKEFFPPDDVKVWAKEYFSAKETGLDYTAFMNALTVPLWDHLERGGKRLRPYLMYLSYKAAGGDGENIMELCILPELLHNASLIIDDIEDSSDMRRGKPCIHLTYGLDVAVNAGNFLYFLPLLIIHKAKLPDHTRLTMFWLVLSEMTKLHLGQTTDIYWHRGNAIPDEKAYLRMCANKTGGLARMAARLGALAANATPKAEKSLGAFAEKVGIAFQIRDDTLNIKPSEVWGKEFGEDISEGKRSIMVIHALKKQGGKKANLLPDGDITEGKRTLSVVHAMHKLSANDRKRLVSILNSHTKDRKLITEAIALMERAGSIAYAEARADELVKEALDLLDDLPKSDAKDKLKELALYAVKRDI